MWIVLQRYDRKEMEMERLTPSKYGNVRAIRLSKYCDDEIYNMISKLADYEDTGLTPEQIEQLKAENARLKEQKHARWEFIDGDGNASTGTTEWAIYECSHCGCECGTDDGNKPWNYCPNCGARMDENDRE